MSDVFFLDPDYAGEYDSKNSFNTMRLKPDTLDLMLMHSSYVLTFSAALIIIVLLILFLMATLPSYNNARHLELEGVVTDMFVTGCHIIQRKDDEVFVISYTYTVDEVVYDDYANFYSSSTCTNFTIGNVLQGVYWPESPALNWLDSNRPVFSSNTSLILIISVSLTLLFLVIICLFDSLTYAWKLRKYRLLIKKGIVLDGELIDADHFTSYGDISHLLTVRYTFVTPKNRELICTQQKVRGDLLDRKAPRKGTPIKVLYADDNACVML